MDEYYFEELNLVQFSYHMLCNLNVKNIKNSSECAYVKEFCLTRVRLKQCPNLTLRIIKVLVF